MYVTQEFRNDFEVGDSIMGPFASATSTWNTLGYRIKIIANDGDPDGFVWPWAVRDDGVSHVHLMYLSREEDDDTELRPAGVEEETVDPDDPSIIIESDVYLNKFFVEYAGHDGRGDCCYGYDWRIWNEAKNSTFTREDGNFIHVQSVLAHEFGHSLGLGHPTFSDTRAVMSEDLGTGIIRTVAEQWDEGEMDKRYKCKDDKPTGGCFNSLGPTVGLVSHETASLFVSILSSKQEHGLGDELKRLVLTHARLTAAVNTFIVMHRSLLESPMAVLTGKFIDDFDALVDEFLPYASPELRTMLTSFARFLKDKHGWTLAEAAGGYLKQTNGVGAIAATDSYPNPFNNRTVISYELREQLPVKLQVFNLIGERVALLVDEVQVAGHHRVPFDAAGLSSGVYIYRLSTPKGELTKAMTLVR